VMLAKPGDAVRAGEPLLELHADDPSLFERAVAALDGGIEVGERHDPTPLILDRIG
jgi:thymidine phosphorylase